MLTCGEAPHVEWGVEGLWGEVSSELRAFSLRDDWPWFGCRGLSTRRNQGPFRSQSIVSGTRRRFCRKSCPPAGFLPGSGVSPRNRAQRDQNAHAPSAGLWWKAELRGPSGAGRLPKPPHLHPESKTQGRVLPGSSPLRSPEARPTCTALREAARAGRKRTAGPSAPGTRPCQMALPLGGVEWLRA